jgi:uncharacterized membrane protein YdjX (TVP38/TMEM64 family)
MPKPLPPSVRYFRLGGWLLFLVTFLYIYFFRLYFFRSNVLTSDLRGAMSTSMISGYVLYLLIGCVRGFTLIPSTSLVLLAIPIFPPLPLFGLTLAGILISSMSIYYFSESLHLNDAFEGKHGARVQKLKKILQGNSTIIIFTWSLFPLVPTDLICYVCGVLRIDFRKFIIGVFLGEGAICGFYIFLGAYVMRLLHATTTP